jgi:hypothetical protein
VRRVPLTLRALLLVPLLAVAVDQARATLACGPQAESCLEAAGHGWVGPAGTVLLVIYALVLAFGVARLARSAPSSVSRFVPPASAVHPAYLWLVGSLGVAAVCGGQALLAGAIGDPGALGGGWLELLALCAASGGVIALALRAAPAAAALVRALRPRAPLARLVPPLAVAAPAPPARRAAAPLSLAAAGRAPPLTLG